MILQGKKSNYDTDVFQPTIQRIAAMSGKTYGADEKCDVAMRVVADTCVPFRSRSPTDSFLRT